MTPRASYPDAGEGSNDRVRGAALSPLRRGTIALAMGATALGTLLLSGLVLFANDPPLSPPLLAELFALQVALPALVAWLVWRASAATATACAGPAGEKLVIETGGRRVEVPLASIARLEGWRLPLPAPGFALRLGSGARLPVRLAAADPAPLLVALARAGVPGAREAQAGAVAAWAQARTDGTRRRHRVRTLLLRFPLFALMPAVVLFQVHQRIAFGGVFGEWYLIGPGAWLRTAFVHWGATLLLLLLYAAWLRAALEAVCLLGAALAPARAAGVRRAARRVEAVLYYGGVPALLALRFLA